MLRRNPGEQEAAPLSIRKSADFQRTIFLLFLFTVFDVGTLFHRTKFMYFFFRIINNELFLFKNVCVLLQKLRTQSLTVMSCQVKIA